MTHAWADRSAQEAKPNLSRHQRRRRRNWMMKTWPSEKSKRLVRDYFKRLSQKSIAYAAVLARVIFIDKLTDEAL